MSEISPKTATQWQAEAAQRYRAGNLAGAAEALKTAAELDPAETAYLCNLAELARVAGRPDEARSWLETAEQRAGSDVRRLNLLAAAWLDLGVGDAAVRSAVRALEAGGGAESRSLFVAAIRHAPRAEHRALLIRAMRESWGPGQALAAPAVAMLHAAWPNTGDALATDELLPQLLVSAVIADPELERRLTSLRRALLLGPRDERLLAVLAGLAIQGSLNGHAWRTSPEEDAATTRVAEKVAAGTADAGEIASLAAYRTLDGLPGAEALLARSWPEPVARVLAEQVAAPREERALAAALPRLTPVRSASAEVRQQYEEDPYPRWSKLNYEQTATIGRILRLEFPTVEIAPLPERPEVLIAGCGTGQHALTAALRYEGAQVLAVDLSLASLGYAARKAKAAGADNVAFAQADILELGSLDRSFDVIECVGVLHHLTDPFEGARVLAGLLRPGGVMKVGVYSATARRSLAPAKTLAKGFPRTREGIRAFRAAVLDAAEGDPVRAAVRFSDFYAASSCRDLLMHVQEREMALADVGRMADENGLRLLGLSVPAGVRVAYQRMFPADTKGADLANWTEFERRRPETFVSLYAAWMQKSN